MGVANRFKMQLVGAVIALALLAGCSTVPEVVTGSEEPLDSYEYLESATSAGRPAATEQLLREGREAWQVGYTGESLQKFGRALRISPDDGLIYYYLASIRKEEGEVGEAVALARRGLFFARQPVLQERLSSLLATTEQ